MIATASATVCCWVSWFVNCTLSLLFVEEPKQKGRTQTRTSIKRLSHRGGGILAGLLVCQPNTHKMACKTIMPILHTSYAVCNIDMIVWNQATHLKTFQTFIGHPQKTFWPIYTLCGIDNSFEGKAAEQLDILSPKIKRWPKLFCYKVHKHTHKQTNKHILQCYIVRKSRWYNIMTSIVNHWNETRRNT